MFDTSPTGLAQLIRAGESERVEFKSSLPSDKILARQLTAFANTRGGILIIGVGPDGDPQGLPPEEAQRTAERLRKVSSIVCEWSTRVGIAEIHGRIIVYLEIEPAPPHLSPTMTSSGEIYERRGTQNVPLTGSESLRFVRQHSLADQQLASPTHLGRPCNLFVAMSFRDEQEPALVDYFHAMKRAVERTKLAITVKRMDLMEGDYEISQQLMTEIDDADIVLADFTLNSSNVYFELGYARGNKKRVIQTARKDVPLEFDVRNWRTIVYRNATELEEKLLLELKAAHAEIMKLPPTEDTAA